LSLSIPAAAAGLCLDTGHLAFSGMDPVAALRHYAKRLDYIHFKDIDSEVYAKVMAERIRFFDTVAKGGMCPIGVGSIDYPTIRRTRTKIAYGGYITIEQERDPRNAGSILADLARSRAYLTRAGF